MITYRNLTQYLDHLSSDSYPPTRIPQVEDLRTEYRQMQRIILGALEKGDLSTEAPSLLQRIRILESTVKTVLTDNFNSKIFLRDKFAVERPLRKLSRDLVTLEQGFSCAQEGLKILGQKTVHDMVVLRMSMVEDDEDSSDDDDSISDDPFGSENEGPQEVSVQPVLENIDVRVPVELPDDFFAQDSNGDELDDPFASEQLSASLNAVSQQDFDPFSEDVSSSRPLQLIKTPPRPSILSILEQLGKEIQKLDIRSGDFTMKCETIKEGITVQLDEVQALEPSQETQTLKAAAREMFEQLLSRMGERQQMFDAVSSALRTIDQETQRMNLQATNFKELGGLIKKALDHQLERIKTLPESDQKRDLHLAFRASFRNLVERMEEHSRRKSAKDTAEPSIAIQLQQISKEILQLNMNSVNFKAEAGAIGDRLVKLSPRIKAVTDSLQKQELSGSHRRIFEGLLKQMEENQKRSLGTSAQRNLDTAVKVRA